MSLVARQLEASGVTTVIVGSARDIVEECGVPRLLFVDFPLGNPCGKPDDVVMQRSIVALALDVAAASIAPRTTVQAPQIWGTDEWRANFMQINDRDRAALQRAGAARRAAAASSTTTDQQGT